MASEAEIDPRTLLNRYAWAPQPVYSPPERWQPNLLLRMKPGLLSPFLDHAWSNEDLSKIPLLVPHPPWNCETELADLFAMKALRSAYAPLINAENSDRGYFIRDIRLRLLGAGANLRALLANGRTLDEQLDKLLILAFRDAECVVLNQKAAFNRSRPYQLAPALFPMFTPRHAAYPSGHSTQMHLAAWVVELALRPTRFHAVGVEWVDFATAVARRREIAGVHYASDTVAGMLLAKLIVDRYCDSPRFQADYLQPFATLP